MHTWVFCLRLKGSLVFLYFKTTCLRTVTIVMAIAVQQRHVNDVALIFEFSIYRLHVPVTRSVEECTIYIHCHRQRENVPWVDDTRRVTKTCAEFGQSYGAVPLFFGGGLEALQNTVRVLPLFYKPDRPLGLF